MTNFKQPISEWLSDIPQAAEAIEEMKRQGREDSEVSSVFVAIHMAFHWISSVKGFDYWYYQFKNIKH